MTLLDRKSIHLCPPGCVFHFVPCMYRRVPDENYAGEDLWRISMICHVYMAAVDCHSQNFANAGIPLALIPADLRRQPFDEITSPRKSDRMMTLIE